MTETVDHVRLSNLDRARKRLLMQVDDYTVLFDDLCNANSGLLTAQQLSRAEMQKSAWEMAGRLHYYWDDDNGEYVRR
jgi:hypothetical protein